MANEELWTTMHEIRERTVCIETQLAAYTSQVSERCQVRAERIEKVEDRLERLEKKVWCMIGASAILSSLGTQLLATLLRSMGN
jgi:hypothetical protein